MFSISNREKGHLLEEGFTKREAFISVHKACRGRLLELPLRRWREFIRGLALYILFIFRSYF